MNPSAFIFMLLCCCSALAGENRELTANGYIVDWLSVGPFPNSPHEENADSMDFDFLASIGGERYIKPTKNQVLHRAVQSEENKDVDLNWQSFIAPQGTREYLSVVDRFALLNGHFPITSPAHLIGYFYVELDSATALPVQIRISAHGTGRIWVNGKRLGSFKTETQGGLTPDQERFDTTLQPGMNRLLLKLGQGEFKVFNDFDNGSDMMVRIVDMDGAALTGKVKVHIPFLNESISKNSPRSNID